MTARTQGPDRVFIAHLHAFRGFAIVMIVAAHSWSGVIFHVGPDKDAPSDFCLDAVTGTLFHGSTLYFALISGLLFSVVLRSRGWPRFFSRKLTNVIAPYALFSLIVTVVTWLNFAGQGSSPAALDPGSLARAGLHNVLAGEAMSHLWYIPVLALLFLATPLVSAALDRASTRWVIIPLVLAPLGVSRVWPDFSFNNVVYFMGAYAAGMSIGRDYEANLARIARGLMPLAIVAGLATLMLLWLYLEGIDRMGPVSIRESVFYVQKMALALVVLALMRQYEAWLPAWLGVAATCAFAVYFFHPLILMLLGRAASALLQSGPGLAATILLGLVFWFLTLLITVALSAAARRILGAWSRPLIGA